MWRHVMSVGLAAAMALSLAHGAEAARRSTHHRHLARLRVSSHDIRHGGTFKDQQVANSFGCKGGNVSPEIRWSHAPAGTKSFAVTMFDPDAPTGSGFWHWVVFNIPSTVHELPKNAGDLKTNLAPPGAVQSRTDFGVPGYNGPCPPPGDRPHRYRISVYAVDVPHLDGDQNTPAAVIGFQLHFHAIAKGVLIGHYGRKK